MGHPRPQQLMQQALAAQRGGSIGEAKRLYALVLRVDPGNAAAYGNLAVIAAGEGDLADAERLIRQQIGLRPDDAKSHHNLGTLLQQQGRPADAAIAHRHAIKLNPNYAQAHLALGNALKAQHRLDEAMQSYLAVSPSSRTTRKPTTISAWSCRCRAGSTKPLPPIAKPRRCRPMWKHPSISASSCIRCAISMRPKQRTGRSSPANPTSPPHTTISAPS